MKRRKTQTNVLIVNRNMQVNLDTMGNVLDFSLRNNGNASAEVNVNGSGKILLGAGDPMMSYTGYWNSFRRDILNIVFGSGSTPRIEIQFTVDLGPCDFDV